ncbi:helicase sen1 [Schizosaccharomyces japonicus yFS275]|uniref:Helicase sen1 n=1 Tax=Schizosaccharomyces japonicus (strain yFS275 / FY16936) TaxID=402676 RepID=B6K1Y0_SCHJY|nr:helicase sen1 [Schizosaccharomyces japonicus yFS275]EEB07161.1 helicase sen1 [Schizosaccharomyces japonicus yFS275]
MSIEELDSFEPAYTKLSSCNESQHWFCACLLNPELEQAFTWMAYDPTPATEWVFRGISERLESCTACVDAYYQLRDSALNKLDSTFTGGSVNSLATRWNDWDVQRIQLLLQKLDGEEEAENSVLSTTVYEVLRNPVLFSNSEIIERTVPLFDRLKDLWVSKTFLLGMLCFAFLERHDELRQWFADFVGRCDPYTLTDVDFDYIYDTVVTTESVGSTVFCVPYSDESWTRIQSMLSVLSAAHVSAFCSSKFGSEVRENLLICDSVNDSRVNCALLCCPFPSFWEPSVSTDDVLEFLGRLVSSIDLEFQGDGELSSQSWAQLFSSFFATEPLEILTQFLPYIETQGLTEEQTQYVCYQMFLSLYDNYFSANILPNPLHLLLADLLTDSEKSAKYLGRSAYINSLKWRSLSYDVLYVEFMHVTLNNDHTASFDTSYQLSAFWTEYLVADKQDLLSWFPLISLFDEVEISEHDSVTKTITFYTDVWQKLQDNVCAYLEQLSTKSVEELTTALSDYSNMHAILCLLLSPSQQLYVAAFKVFQKLCGSPANRAETMKLLIEKRINVLVQSLAESVLQWQSLLTYRPALRTLRYIMGFIRSLNGLDLSIIKNTDALTLGTFWQTIWSLLNSVFTNIARWSLVQQRDSVKATMKLTLNFVTGLFENNGLFITLLPRFDALILLGECSEALFSLVKWLKINDHDMREVIVNSIGKLFVKFSNFDYMFEERTVTFLLEFIEKKKRAHLSADQCNRLAGVLKQTSSQANEFFERQKALEAKQRKEQTKLMNASKVSRPDKPSVAPRPLIKPKAAPKTTTSQARVGMLETLKQDFLVQRRNMLKQVSAGHVTRKYLPNMHTPSNLLSDNESDDEEDEESRKSGLFSLARANKTPQIREAKRKPIQFINTAVTSMHPSQARMMAKKKVENTKALLFPNITNFFKEILKWPPSSNHHSPKLEFHKSYSPVINSFSSVKHYQEVMQPMIFLECWSQIQSEKMNLSTRCIKSTLLKRSAVSDFVDIMVGALESDLVGYPLADTEMVVLAFNDEYCNELTKDECVFAQVTRLNRHKSGPIITLRTCPPVKFMNRLQNNCTIYFKRMMNLSTYMRQYAATCGLPYYNLVEDVIKGHPCSQPVKHSAAEIERAQKRYGVNEPQAHAILASLDNVGFTLIQGPPGTGKTKTIVGIVSALLLDLNNYHITRPDSKQDSEKTKQKILLCAPSNAAVDEVILRLKRGFTLQDGSTYKPKLVRIGNAESVNMYVRDTSIEYQTEKQLLEVCNDLPELTVLKELTHWRDVYYDSLQAIENLQKQLDIAKSINENVDAVSTELNKMFEQKNLAEQKIDEFQDHKIARNRDLDMTRRKIQQALLKECDVVCSTLSGSGHELVARANLTFNTVIIDEAAQAVELDTIIPLKYGAARCVLVGDPNQLPPTILSKKAVKLNYSQSMFVRIQNNFPEQLELLSIQYRMHPEISQFPSCQFYNSRLLDGDNVATKTLQPWHKNPLFGQYRVFDVRGTEKQSKTFSLYNPEEAKSVTDLFDLMTSSFPTVDFASKIGIVTPYRSQLKELRRAFSRKYGRAFASKFDMNTIDGFQGQEKDIIILSCVRSETGGSIGFLRDFRRLNVALTRARSSLFIVGNVETLFSDDLWGSLLANAKERGLILYSLLSENKRKAVEATVDAAFEKRKRKLVEAETEKKNGTVLQESNSNGDSTSTDVNSEAPALKKIKIEQV